MKLILARLTSLYLRLVPWRRGKKRLARWLGPYCEGVPLPTTYGFPIYTRLYDNTNRLCFEGRPDRVVDFMRNLPEGATVLDIGANQGAMAILASRVVGGRGVVLAFEPGHNTAKRLRANQVLNRADNMTVFQQAIGRRVQKLSIGTLDSLHSGAAYIGGGNEQITVSPLLEVLGVEALLGERPIYAKIDTEGYELEVLHGLAPLLETGHVKRLIIEIDDDHLSRFDADAATLYQLLGGYGYQPLHGLQTGHYDELFYLTEKGNA